MLKVSGMLLNSLTNGTTSITDVRGPTGARNQVNTLTILRADRVLNRLERTPNGVEGPKG